MTRVFLLGALTVVFGACLPSGGGGGGDCREADDACSDGFVCVAVGGGSTYDCRAECFDDDECLREEQCSPDGICVDREGPPPAEDDARVVVIDPPDPADMSVPDDAEVIRILDGAPDPADAAPVDAGPAEDSGVIIVPEPGMCGSDGLPAIQYLLAIEFAEFEGFPFYVTLLNTNQDRETRTFDMSINIVDLDGVEVSFVSGVADGVWLIDDEGRFSVDAYDYVFPPETNQLGGEVVMSASMDLQLREDGTLCGTVDAEFFRPPLGDLPGVAAGRFFSNGGNPPAEREPFRFCDGCLP